MTGATIIPDVGLTVREARALARTAGLFLAVLGPDALGKIGEPELLKAQVKLEVALMLHHTDAAANALDGPDDD